MIGTIVYFSSATRNTARFADRMTQRGFKCIEIPMRAKDGDIPEVTTPYALISPTYGGGESMVMGNIIEHEKTRPIPPQVEKFLACGDNAQYMRCVIGAGNRNFHVDYCLAARKISQQYGVPHVWNFELMGTEEDANIVAGGLNKL